MNDTIAVNVGVPNMESIPVTDEDSVFRKALEELVLDSEGFAPLENSLADFNVFEAIGHTHAESRHSNFLAFLLDPNASHGLGDFFLRRFVQLALSSLVEADRKINLIEFSMAELDFTTVEREYKNIDIFIKNTDKKFTIVIENKFVPPNIHSNYKGIVDILRAYPLDTHTHYI